MANEIGMVKGINGNSTCLNNQAGQGAAKPSATAGKVDPGGFKPPQFAPANVPMPK